MAQLTTRPRCDLRRKELHDRVDHCWTLCRLAHRWCVRPCRKGVCGRIAGVEHERDRAFCERSAYIRAVAAAEVYINDRCGDPGVPDELESVFDIGGRKNACAGQTQRIL